MPSGNLQGIHGGSKTPRDDTSIMDEQTAVNHEGRKVRKITEEPLKPIYFGDRFPPELIDRIDQFLSRQEHMMFHRSYFAQISKDYKKYSAAHQNKLTGGIANFENLPKLIKSSPKLCNLVLLGNNYYSGRYDATSSFFFTPVSTALNVECIPRGLHTLCLLYTECNAEEGKVNQLVASLTVLQRLTLYRCDFSDRLSFSALTQLRSLTVKSCTTPSINLDFSVLTNLELLTLASDLATNLDLDLSLLIKLQGLKLDCRYLKSVQLPAANQLKSLKVNASKYLTSLDLTALTQLSSLKVKNCDSLTSLTLPAATQLQLLAISCFELKKLDYPAYPNLKSLKLSYEQTKSLPLLAATQLQFLTIKRAAPLTNFVLSVLTQLQSLTIARCKSLDSPDLSAFTCLQTLKLVGQSPNNLTLPLTTHSLTLDRCASLNSLDFSVFTNLQSLTIVPVERYEVFQFQQRLPGFEICYDDTSRVLRASKKRAGDSFKV